MINNLNLSSGLPFSGSLITSSNCCLFNLTIVSSIEKYSSIFLSLIAFNKPVAIYICISIVLFLSVNSGKAVIADFKYLTERKRTIDMHMYIATGLLNAIKERKIDEYFSMEETIVKLNKQQLLEVINDPEKGKPEDKLRLFIMYMLSVENITQEDFVEYKNALIDAGCTVECLDYLRKIHAFTKMSNMTNTQNSGDLLGKFSSFGSKLKEGRIENLISGVKNIFPASKDLPITKIVDSLLDTGGFSSSSEHEEYLYFDPKSVKGSDPTKVPNNRMQFQDAIVFVVGGGNYNEYQNLLEYANRQNPPKTITYGTTELLTAQEFIDQLNTLGTEN